MRVRPRTWPSIRRSRFVTDALAFACMRPIYPYRVPVSRGSTVTHSSTAHDHIAHSHAHGAGATAIDMATDPVCGMKVDPAKSPHRFTYRNHDYHFCSADCRTKFTADPE